MILKPRRPVDRVFIHCSANANPHLAGRALVAEIDRWHRRRGFSGIGYHWLIDFAGLVLVGRDPERIPAAQQGNNARTLAICCHGLAVGDFTAPQMAALRGVCTAIDQAYGGTLTVHGHCEVSRKLCPVFDYRAVLALDPAGRLGHRAAPPGSPV